MRTLMLRSYNLLGNLFHSIKENFRNEVTSANENAWQQTSRMDEANVIEWFTLLANVQT